ncbi:MAG: formate/nitrite transporter family protein [Alphaproteobacteria bacterium]|nr:formate/nitrite transporter family protein [Alphaproteobacteria bacterium]
MSESPHLEHEQRKQAEDSAPLRATVIHEVIRAEGEADLRLGPRTLLWSGLAAGLSMGFSFAGQALLSACLPQAPWAHAVSSFGYVVGFAIVVLGRQHLFTESTLSAALPALMRRDAETTVRMLRLWGLVIAANIVGTWLFAAALTWANPLGPEAIRSLAKISAESLSNSFGVTLVKAIFAGWLIALMVWLLPTAGSAKILIIALLTWVVALGRLSHVIAGSTEAAYGVLTGHAAFVDYVMAFFLPTLIGNTIGGGALVAMLNHAPVRREIERSSEEAEGPGR